MAGEPQEYGPFSAGDVTGLANVIADVRSYPSAEACARAAIPAAVDVLAGAGYVLVSRTTAETARRRIREQWRPAVAPEEATIAWAVTEAALAELDRVLGPEGDA